MSMRNCSDTTGNRTRDLPACSALPQTTAPARAPIWTVIHIITTAKEINISARPLVCKLTAGLSSNLKLPHIPPCISPVQRLRSGTRRVFLLNFCLAKSVTLKMFLFAITTKNVCRYLTGLRKWIMNRQARERVFLGQNNKHCSDLIVGVTDLYYSVIRRGRNRRQPPVHLYRLQ